MGRKGSKETGRGNPNEGGKWVILGSRSHQGRGTGQWKDSGDDYLGQPH